jgi:hypothetical protein
MLKLISILGGLIIAGVVLLGIPGNTEACCGYDDSPFSGYDSGYDNGPPDTYGGYDSGYDNSMPDSSYDNSMPDSSYDNSMPDSSYDNSMPDSSYGSGYDSRYGNDLYDKYDSGYDWDSWGFNEWSGKSYINDYWSRYGLGGSHYENDAFRSSGHDGYGTAYQDYTDRGYNPNTGTGSSFWSSWFDWGW